MKKGSASLARTNRNQTVRESFRKSHTKRKKPILRAFSCCARVQNLYPSKASLLSPPRREQIAPKEDDRKN